MGDGGVVDDVLVVDDHPGDRRFIREVFKESQFDLTIHSVETRVEALDLVTQERANADAPDLDVILLDWNLSQTTGKEVLEAAKTGDSSIPVIVMTGAKVEEDGMKSTLSRADKYIEKPTDPEGYIEALGSIVDQEHPE